MSSLSVYLPPFASDYAGAASALFDWDCLVAINDASCCTSHFASYEEPRWKTGKRQTLCTNLRMNDAVFGIDERVTQQLGEAARELNAQRIVALGTPVPAIIGTDMKGLACDLEDTCGIPAYGLDTTGFDTYVRGIDKVFDLVISTIDPTAARKPEPIARPVVNLLGLTPLDYGPRNYEPLVGFLEHQGISVGARLFMGMNEGNPDALAWADCNIALSYAGILAAKKLEKRFGTPYVACSFMGSAAAERAVGAIKALGAGEKPPAAHSPRPEVGKRVLIVADQVIAHTLREEIRGKAEAPVDPSVTLASFFGLDTGIAEEGDVYLPDEAKLLRHLAGNRYDVVVGDPLLQQIPAVWQTPFVPLAHPAVSSRLHWDEVPPISGFGADSLADEVSRIIAGL